jgi:hypothetical protein
MGLKKPNKVEAATTVKEVEQETVVHEEKVVEETAVLVHEEKVVEETAAAETVAEKTVAPGVKEVAAEKVEPEVKEVEVEAEPEVQTTKSETVLAKTSEANTQVAKAPSTGDAFIAQMAEQGHEGLAIGYRSYTTVKLDTGEFVTGDGVSLEEKTFQVHVMGSKPRWLYTDTEEDEGGTVVYTSDKVYTTDGTPLDDIIAEWKAEDKPVIIKPYLDVTVDVISGTLEGEIVVLSVPKSGIERYSGHVGRAVYMKMDIRNVVTEVRIGKKVTNKAGKTYYPWDFKLVR